MTTGDERMKTLFVLLGSTGIGKTDLCLSIADLLCCPIVNADSRQIYRELPIGTAAPTLEQQEHTRHYFVGTHSLTQNYSAAQYGEDARQLLSHLFRQYDHLLLSGGSMLYIDTVCHGIDSLPTVDETTRQLMKMRLESEGLPKLVEELKQLDPVWAERVDIHNPRRVIHALEICHITGQPYSSLIGRHRQDWVDTTARRALRAHQPTRRSDDETRIGRRSPTRPTLPSTKCTQHRRLQRTLYIL